MESKLPKNWVETELNNLTSYVIGGDWGKDPDSVNDDDYIEVFCIRGSEIKNWNQNKGNTASLRKIKRTSLENRKLKKGDVLLEISGGGPDQPVGRTVIIDDEVLNFEPEVDKVCTNFLRLVRFYKDLNSNYINHYLQYFYNSGEIVKYQGGSNNLRNLKFKEYETIRIPIPPLAEQNRIVAKLDTLFAQLETIKASMAKVPLLLKDFRQQVLTQAVTGKLTEEWRNGKELEVWKVIRFEEIVISSNNGISKRSGTSGKETVVLRLADFKDGLRVYGNERKIILTDKEKEKYLLIENDLLVIRVNGSVSLAGLFVMYKDENIEEAYCDHFIRYRINNELVMSKYLTYVTNNGLGRNYLRNSLSTSAGQNTINQKSISDLEFNLPTLLEQQEIVSRVENLFAKADAIEKQYETLKVKIESLPQAILHKAFKGELTEQLDTDGDARELLREIEMLKRAQQDKSKKGKSKTTKSVAKTVKQS